MDAIKNERRKNERLPGSFDVNKKSASNTKKEILITSLCVQSE
jgi:hypothetical protein